MEYQVSKYIDFPVNETFELNEMTDVKIVVDKMINVYINFYNQNEFSYRVLLPRNERSTSKAKKLGFAVQGEFLLALKKKGLKPNIKEFRYLHDNNHYGWLLVNPEKFESYFKKQ